MMNMMPGLNNPRLPNAGPKPVGPAGVSQRFAPTRPIDRPPMMGATPTPNNNGPVPNRGGLMGADVNPYSRVAPTAPPMGNLSQPTNLAPTGGLNLAQLQNNMPQLLAARIAAVRANPSLANTGMAQNPMMGGMNTAGFGRTFNGRPLG